MSIGPTRSLLKRHVLPESGEGPDKETREKGFYEIHQIGDLLHVGKRRRHWNLGKLRIEQRANRLELTPGCKRAS